MILFEFKNYDREDIGKEEVNQARNYMTKPMGRLGILCCNYLPNHAAHIKRNSIFSEDGKIILFLTVENMKEMHMCPLKLLPLSYHDLRHRRWSLCVQGAGVSSRGVDLRRRADGASWGLSRYA